MAVLETELGTENRQWTRIPSSDVNFVFWQLLQYRSCYVLSGDDFPNLETKEFGVNYL